MRCLSVSPELGGTPTVVLTARMLWDKGVGEFVEAARLLRAKGIKARFLLVGAPDPLNPSTVPEDTLRGWNTEGIVEWLGYQDDIRKIIADSGLPIIMADTLAEAAEKAVQARNQVVAAQA